jgi:hypothetical protein
MAAQNPILQRTVSGQIVDRRGSWLGRNWKWLLLVAFLAVIVFVTGLVALIMGGIRSSDVAKEAVARAQANPAVVKRLGAGIDEGWMMSGSINVAAGGTGDADLAVPISGSKGKGTVYVTARKIAGQWNYTQMIARMEGSGEKVDLLSSAQRGEPQSDAPSPPPPAAANLEPQAARNSAEAAATIAPQPGAAAANSSAAASSDIIQSQDANIPGVVGELTQCKRSGGVLSVKIRFHNTSGTAVSFYVLGPNISYDTFYFSAASKKYFILKDANGTYLAPGGDYSCGMPGVCEKLGAGQSNTWWAKFPAPPADVAKVDLYTPVTPPFEDIPITDK